MLMFHFLFKPQRHFNFSFPGLIWYQDPGKFMQGMLAPLKSICKSFVKSVCLTMWKFFYYFYSPNSYFSHATEVGIAFKEISAQIGYSVKWINCPSAVLAYFRISLIRKGLCLSTNVENTQEKIALEISLKVMRVWTWISFIPLDYLILPLIEL